MADKPSAQAISSGRNQRKNIPVVTVESFYQAHAGGPLTSMAGMGLGLYISRQIVELHGGTIEAHFPEDGGAKFVVTLPR